MEVQVFWFGGSLPRYQRFCLQTLVKAGFKPQLWCYDALDAPAGVTRRDAREIVPVAVADAWATLRTPPHAKQTFANYFRYKLMYRLGGWWADADIWCFVDSHTQWPQDDYVFTAIHDIRTRTELLASFPDLPPIGGNLANGLFKVPPRDPIMQDLIDLTEPAALRVECPELFGFWGTILFTTAVKNHGRYHVTPMIGNGWSDRFAPYKALTEAGSFTVPPWTKVLHLYHYASWQVRPSEDSLYSRWEREIAAHTAHTAASAPAEPAAPSPAIPAAETPGP